MITAIQKTDTAIEPLRRFSNCVLSPLLDLGIRIFAANIFFWSGKSKFDNYLNNDWEATLYLFKEAHIVPFLPVDVAAALGTGTELILSAFLALGLFTRAEALGLLLTTLLIQFFVVDGFGESLSNSDHYFWMLLLAVPLIKGPGKLSLDTFILKWIR